MSEHPKSIEQKVDRHIDKQIYCRHGSFWRERSLCYLCRAFDNLNKGDYYSGIRPAIHIGILDFELSPQHPEFYATYHLANDITHEKYSDNFRLSVLQLKHVDIATEEDRRLGLDLWAKFFKADSWEVIHMLAKQNPSIASAASTLYRVSENEEIRLMCEVREAGEKTLRTLEVLYQREKDRAEQALRQNEATEQALRRSNRNLQQKDSEIQQLDTQLAAALARIAELEAMQQK